MYRIRFHGRGGQGMKTAGRILGNAFFQEGWEVQDSPKYGAERRGAPITSAVRADRQPIHERGVIQRPDLVVVADDTLVPVQTAEVLAGLSNDTVLLIDSNTDADTWRRRLGINSSIHTLPVPNTEDRAEQAHVGAICAGAAARLIGRISVDSLETAVREELEGFAGRVIETNVANARQGFELMAAYEGTVSPGDELTAADYTAPGWIELTAEKSELSAPTIYRTANSVQVRTGLWRTMRPVIEYDHCNRCNWVCGSFCPDSAISIDDNNYPVIDLEHCKGCLICVAQCPPHAIVSIPEQVAIAAAEEAST